MAYKKYWSKSRCTKIAKKYTMVSEFRKNEPHCYQAACRNKWLKEYSWMTGFKTTKAIWTYEKVLEEAKKYTSRSEFIKANSGAYSSAHRHGWLSDFVWLGNGRGEGKWNLERAMSIARCYKTRTDFAKAHRYAYAICLKHGVCDELFGNKKKTGRKADHAE